MGWKFWKKEAQETQKKTKLPGPKELPDAVGRKLVVDMKMDPDWTWSLKALIRRRETDKQIRDFRIFDPDKSLAAGISVKNFDSLDGHPNQILFAGWYNIDTGEVQLTQGSSDKAA
jgi:hypothetical protein